MIFCDLFNFEKKENINERVLVTLLYKRDIELSRIYFKEKKK